MIVGGDSLWKQYRSSKKYTTEEEFYLKLLENPVWPFENLGDGIYHLRLISSRIFAGIVIIIATSIAGCYFLIASGIFTFPTTVCVIMFVFGVMCILGKLTTQELIVGREIGYLLRLEVSRKVIVEQDIYNIYIRLQRKADSIQNQHFYLIIGGYLLDDIRISRMTNKEEIIRFLGRHLAYNLGINYFDYYDDTTKHQVYHFRRNVVINTEEKDTFHVLFENKDADFKNITDIESTEKPNKRTVTPDYNPALRRPDDGFAKSTDRFSRKEKSRRARSRKLLDAKLKQSLKNLAK